MTTGGDHSLTLATVEPCRPALRWHGGKWLLAPWIVSLMPPRRSYVEPFGGAASVLLRKPRDHAEIYNDLDDQVVGLFRILRDPERATRLIAAIEMTPFARTEFLEAYIVSPDPIEEARRLVVRSFMGFGSDGHNRANRTGFRANSNRSGTTPARDWMNYPDGLRQVVDRLRGVIIEQRPAIDVMRQHDGPDTLHYVDPPYLPAVRSDKPRRGGGTCHAYAHELTETDHVDLLNALQELDGAVMLSGYPAPLYDDLLPGWQRVERRALADGARERVEVLWLNARAAAGARQRSMLAFAS